MSHSHHTSPWPFSLPVNTAVFVTRQVMEGTEPIREVYHDPDGDWQLLCGTSRDVADLKLVCLGCLVDKDPSLGQLADLPEGWSATRAQPHSPWRTQATPASAG